MSKRVRAEISVFLGARGCSERNLVNRSDATGLTSKRIELCGGFDTG